MTLLLYWSIYHTSKVVLFVCLCVPVQSLTVTSFNRKASSLATLFVFPIPRFLLIAYRNIEHRLSMATELVSRSEGRLCTYLYNLFQSVIRVIHGYNVLCLWLAVSNAHNDTIVLPYTVNFISIYYSVFITY